MTATEKKEVTPELLAGCLGAVGALALLPLSLIWQAFAYATLWRWFAPAAGLPALGLGTVGIALLLWNCLTNGLKVPAPETPKGELVKGMVKRAAQMLGVLAVGYAFHVWGGA